MCVKLTIRLSIYALVLVLASNSSASALSCKEIKSSYERAMGKYRFEVARYETQLKTVSSKSYKQEQAFLIQQNSANDVKCMKAAKTSNDESVCRTKYLKNFYSIIEKNQPDKKIQMDALNVAQRIVLNNKKCFDPLLVAQIQQSRD